MKSEIGPGSAVLGFAVYYFIFSLADVGITALGVSKNLGFSAVSLISVLVLFFLLTFMGTGEGRRLGTRKGSSDFLSGSIGGIILGALATLGMFNSNLGIFSMKYLLQEIRPDSLFGMILFLVLFVAALPVADELYFRGFMYPIFEKNYNTIIAAIVTSFFSSIFMSGAISFLLMFIAGLVFAFLYKRTGALFSGLVAHVAFNMIIAIIMFIKGGS